MKRPAAILLLVLCFAIPTQAQDTVGNHTFKKVFLELRYQNGMMPEGFSTGRKSSFCTGIGGQLAYVPSRWGVYGALQYMSVYSKPNLGFCIGGVYRVTSPHNWIDLQLYGGIADGEHPGIDFGLRLAPRSKVGRMKYSLWSLTAGIDYQSHTPFFTLGLSLGTIGTLSLSTLLTGLILESM